MYILRFDYHDLKSFVTASSSIAASNDLKIMETLKSSISMELLNWIKEYDTIENENIDGVANIKRFKILNVLKRLGINIISKDLEEDLIFILFNVADEDVTYSILTSESPLKYLEDNFFKIENISELYNEKFWKEYAEVYGL